MTIRDEFKEYLKNTEINEMAPNYPPDKTGLNEPIWISVENASHGPRIKVYSEDGEGNFSVSISDSPRIVAGNCFVSSKELKRIIKFISLNKETLLNYWEFKITSKELKTKIKKI